MAAGDTADRYSDAATTLHATREQIAHVIAGQRQLVDALLLALICRGHLLIEGVPGLAKTLAVRTLSETTGGTWQRIQFTPDLLPSDITGTRIWNPHQQTFHAEPGPVFANFVLADEINRAPAKVQSALLEAMEERRVTIGRETLHLPDPFVVLATANPIESAGTFDLPEAQADRFLLKVVLDYPDETTEVEIARRHLLGTPDVTVTLDPATVIELAELRASVTVPRDVAVTAVRLARATRSADGVEYGAGPRGTLALVTAAQGRALLHGRGKATADDVYEVAHLTLAHRIVLTRRAVLDGARTQHIVAALVEQARRG